MTLVRLLQAKLHHLTVSTTNRDYVGSIAIDQVWLDAVGLLPLQEVEIVNIDNGERWSTYVLPAPAQSRLVCPNGGGAWLAKPGDRLIVWSYVQRAREEVIRDGHDARILVADPAGGVTTFVQRLVPGPDGITFDNPLIEAGLLDFPPV